MAPSLLSRSRKRISVSLGTSLAQDQNPLSRISVAGRSLKASASRPLRRGHDDPPSLSKRRRSREIVGRSSARGTTASMCP